MFSEFNYHHLRQVVLRRREIPQKLLLQILVHLKGWPFLPGRRPLEYYDFVLSNLKKFFLTLDNR